jgi:hypothetical protein
VKAGIDLSWRCCHCRLPHTLPNLLIRRSSRFKTIRVRRGES